MKVKAQDKIGTKKSVRELNIFNNSAQGTIEYLVILAVIVVIALVIVALLVNSTVPAEGIASTAGKTTFATNPIAIKEAIVTEDGNYLLKLENNTGKNLKISEISLENTTPSNPNTTIPMTGETIFVLKTEDVCREGELVVKQITVRYVNEYGLEVLQTYPIPLQLECENYEVNTDYVDDLGDAYDEEGNLIRQTCGDNIAEGTEICDGTDLKQQTCESILGIDYSGTLACNSTCDGFTTTNCSREQIFITTDTNSFLGTETLYANILNQSDSNTYHYNWYKNGDLNSTSMIENGLIGYWPFDNDALDYYANNDGVLTGTSSVIGKLGNSKYLNGSSEYIRIPDNANLDITNTFTLAVWIKPEDTSTRHDTGGDPIIQREYSYRGFQLLWDYYNGNGQFGIMVSNGSTFNKVQGLANKQIGEWYHVVGVYDGTNAKIYVNGIEENSQAHSFQPNNSLDLYIGVFNNGGYKERYLKATLDEVMFFNRGLSASEINQLYYGGLYGGRQLDSLRTKSGETWSAGYRTNNNSTTWTSEFTSDQVTIQ